MEKNDFIILKALIIYFFKAPIRLLLKVNTASAVMIKYSVAFI